jgi:hypothetical protein
MNESEIKMFDILFSEFPEFSSYTFVLETVDYQGANRPINAETPKTECKGYSCVEDTRIRVHTYYYKSKAKGAISLSYQMDKPSSSKFVNPTLNSSFEKVIDHYNNINKIFDYHSSVDIVVANMTDLQLFYSYTEGDEDNGQGFYHMFRSRLKSHPDIKQLMSSCMSLRLLSNQSFEYFGHSDLYVRLMMDYRKIFPEDNSYNNVINSEDVVEKIESFKNIRDMVRI